MVGESQETVSVGGGSGSSSNKMPTLEEYGTNLTTQATEVRRGDYACHLPMSQQACQHCGVSLFARLALGVHHTHDFHY